uniref:tripeptidyl-peptidase II n=1 Tax=Ganoderma boninense TaxID=34458 RepID=A0A5K1JXR8_9APHY|nr:Oligopeptide transporter OPT-like protein [Ganoderma boninense]
MFWASQASILALVHLAASKPFPSQSKRWDDFRLKHAWDEVPRGWELHGPAPADYTFDLRVALKQDRFHDLVAALYEVSDPAHERYGQHLSKEEVAALVAPHPDSVDLVESWLAAHNLDLASPERSHAGDWITIRVSVAEAEKMLGARYSIFQHGNSDEYVIRTMNYSLPNALHEHVALVSPTTYFGTMKSMKATSFVDENGPTVQTDPNLVRLIGSNSLASVPSSCETTITPSCLWALYNIGNYTPRATNENRLGVVGYLKEYANRADLQQFLQSFRPDAVNSSYTTVLVNDGGDDQSQPGVEANLDIQYTTSISYPTPNIYYSTGGSPPYIADRFTPTNTNEPYLDWLSFILNEKDLPQTITTSYGDEEQTVPHDYATHVCSLFVQLGSRGTTLLFASGDSGVGGGQCLTNDGKNRTAFMPAFPASCPFVTAVGGTTQISPEVAVNFSGGGFSNYFARPRYQSKHVSAYLTGLGDTYSGLFNSSGRAYPDVSAQARGFQVVVSGRVVPVGGTSASSPTFAGVVSLLNDYLISKGKPPLGFLNPLLYSKAAPALNDITSGSNPGCGTSGFSAGEGWDPVTGLGTPNFTALKELLR